MVPLSTALLLASPLPRCLMPDNVLLEPKATCIKEWSLAALLVDASHLSSAHALVSETGSSEESTPDASMSPSCFHGTATTLTNKGNASTQHRMATGALLIVGASDRASRPSEAEDTAPS